MGPLVSTEGNPLHIGREKREKVSTGRFLEFPRPVSSAIRIKASGKSGLKAGLERYCISGAITRGKYLASLTARVLVR